MKAVMTGLALMAAVVVGLGAERRVVTLQPGLHEQAETWTLGPECANTVFRSADPSRPAVISGGRRLAGWQVGADGVWRLTLPEVKEGRWNFSSLYVNGVRRARPSVPRAGYNETVSNAFEVARKPSGEVGGFAFRPGELKAAFENQDDIEVQVLHNWNTTRARIGAIDGERGLLRFAEPRKSTYRGFNFEKRRYRLENVKEAFTEAGTWYLDRPTGVLVYRPLPGETPDGVEMVVPRLQTVVRIDGADGVRFENVVFAHQNLVTPRTGRFASQAAWNVPAAIEVSRARGVSFVGCKVVCTDGYGLEMGEGAEETLVAGCTFRNLGAGGIRTGWFNGTPPARPAARLTVRECRITEGGLIFPEGVGVLIGRSSHNLVVSNEIDHLRYSGVSVGWNWDSSRPSKAHHNEIAFNHIHDIGLGVLSDMGMIYLLGRAPGTTVHDNNLHDVSCFTYGGTGIYPDEGSSELRIWNNLVRNTMRGYHQNYGEDNEVFNNIFVNAGILQWDYRPAYRFDGVTVAMRRNIFVWRKGRLMACYPPFRQTPEQRKSWPPPPGTGCRCESNVYWNVSGGDVRFLENMGIDAWRERSGQDKASLLGDPGFAGDIFAGDCTLKPDAPALRLGFRPFTPPHFAYPY